MFWGFGLGFFNLDFWFEVLFGKVLGLGIQLYRDCSQYYIKVIDGLKESLCSTSKHLKVFGKF